LSGLTQQETMWRFLDQEPPLFPRKDLPLTFRAHRRLYCLALALIAIPAGLVWRFAPLGLPPLLYKYGGSILWAIVLYSCAAAILSKSKPLTVSLLACLLALAVELFRLVHAPGLDAFRLTLAGKLLLGSLFSHWDILAYWFAFTFMAVVDSNATLDSTN
jgi:hypothetical protein